MKFIFRHTPLLLLPVFFSSVLYCADAGDQKTTQGLIITYTAAPARRIALREYMLSEGISHLTELQRGGVINSYQVFFSRYVHNETWDMMLVVLFPQATDIGRWRQVEVQSPAALSSRGLADVQSVSTTPVVRVRSFEPARNSPDSVFLVIPYKVLVPTPDYLSYFNGYVLPQLDGWREEKVLVGYNLYIAQYPAGRAWTSMLVLRYADEASLGDRERIIAKVRDRLQSDPSWKAFADNKASIRSEQELVIADKLQTGR
jgi:hypothetical protein